MNKIITSVVLGMAMILGIATGGTASAAPVKDGWIKTKSVKSKSVKSVCETGYRGQRAYDALCLKTGTFKTGATLWLTIPAGKAGRESVNNFDRRSLCKFAGKTGGTKTTAREAVTDVAYDSYRNHGSVIRWAVAVAVLDCASMGYKIK